MPRYSQNTEQFVIQEYFNGYTGTLLDIGANDGRTFSNSLALIEAGWQAVLVEPGAAFEALQMRHFENDNVTMFNVAIGTKTGTIDLYDMGSHIGKGDKSLLATTVKDEMKRWTGTEFAAVSVDCLIYDDFLKQSPIKQFDFITIDAEGMDVAILQQIDLSEVKCLCIEWNGNKGELEMIRSIVPVEMKEVYRSLENVIYVR